MLERIYEKSDAAYETTIGYLRQEGLLGNVRYAIVDSGWVGTIQKKYADTSGTGKTWDYSDGILFRII